MHAVAEREHTIGNSLLLHAVVRESSPAGRRSRSCWAKKEGPINPGSNPEGHTRAYAHTTLSFFAPGSALWVVKDWRARSAGRGGIVAASERSSVHQGWGVCTGRDRFERGLAERSRAEQAFRVPAWGKVRQGGSIARTAVKRGGGMAMMAACVLLCLVACGVDGKAASGEAHPHQGKVKVGWEGEERRDGCV